jgi:asparagine synthase (glutamine-hydrolysing)
LHSWLSSPGFHWLLESEERLAAYHGIELRHPFLDHDLVEFVLAIPWRTRHALRGPFKTLLLGAMADRLPKVVGLRHGKTGFDDYLSRLYNASRRGIQRELFVGDHWWSGRFIDRQTFEAGLARIQMTEAGGWTDMQSIWIAAAIELWLRDRSRIADYPERFGRHFSGPDPKSANFTHFPQPTDSARVPSGDI